FFTRSYTSKRITLPKGRTALYTIWRACERFGILPPKVEADFYENTSWVQAQVVTYSQIREIEESESNVKSNRPNI
ncbi:hypothetical protein LCGC14_2354270, partial [marine sediment metagenome]